MAAQTTTVQASPCQSPSGRTFVCMKAGTALGSRPRHGILAAAQGVEVKLVPTKPFDGQKTGTSGLRKKTEVFTQEHYLANWCASAHDFVSR